MTDQALPRGLAHRGLVGDTVRRAAAGLPPSVVLPWYTQFAGQDKRIAGQTGGRMGDQSNPFLVEGDPSQAAFKVHGLEPLPDVTAERLASRRELLDR